MGSLWQEKERDPKLTFDIARSRALRLRRSAFRLSGCRSLWVMHADFTCGLRASTQTLRGQACELALESDWRGRSAGRVGAVWILLPRWCDREEVPTRSRAPLRDRKATLDADLLTADPMKARRRTVVSGERIRNVAGGSLAVSITRANLWFRGVARVCAQRTRHRPRSGR